MTTAPTRLTAQDLWRLGDSDTRRELRMLLQHVERQAGVEVLVGDVGFVLELPHDPERVRGPDIAVVRTERLPGGRVPQGFLRGAPDLAVEVMSPSDNLVELQRKVRDYLEAGARLVWVVAPDARTATVCRAGGAARLLTEGDSLQGEDVLPGLTVPLAAVLPPA